MTFTVTSRAKPHPSGRLGRWHPCRRALDGSAVCCHERIGQTAACGKALRDVAVKGCVAAKFVADARLRVKDEDRNPYMVADCLHYRCEIGVARDENKAVGASFVSVAQHCISDVHVRHFFRDAKHLDSAVGPSFAAGRAGFTNRGEEFGLFAIAAFDDFDERAIGKRFEILLLSLGVVLARGFVDYARREVLDGDDDMVWFEELGGESLKVKPLVGRSAKLSVVEVAGVDVDDCAFHFFLLKVQEPGLRPAPRRLPESRRVKRPVIGGSWKFTKDSGDVQGDTRKNLKFSGFVEKEAA